MTWEPENYGSPPSFGSTSGNQWGETFKPGVTGGREWAENKGVNMLPVKRGPMDHFLESKAWWNNLEWGVNTVAEFVQAIEPWLNDPNKPALIDGDKIVGLDKNDNQVILFTNQVADARGDKDQQPAPK